MSPKLGRLRARTGSNSGHGFDRNPTTSADLGPTLGQHRPACHNFRSPRQEILEHAPTKAELLEHRRSVGQLQWTSFLHDSHNPHHFGQTSIRKATWLPGNTDVGYRRPRWRRPNPACPTPAPNVQGLRWLITGEGKGPNAHPCSDCSRPYRSPCPRKGDGAATCFRLRSRRCAPSRKHVWLLCQAGSLALEPCASGATRRPSAVTHNFAGTRPNCGWSRTISADLGENLLGSKPNLTEIPPHSADLAPQVIAIGPH